MVNRIYGSAKTIAKASAIGMTFIAYVKHKVAMIKKTFRNSQCNRASETLNECSEEIMAPTRFLEFTPV
jgi:hypothetical protein